MPVRRGTSNSNVRGSSYQRRARKLWLLQEFGDGHRAPCYMFVSCGQWLTFETITVDRIKMGCEGGTYQRDNIRPACAFHNSSTGGKAGNRRKQEMSDVLAGKALG